MSQRTALNPAYKGLLVSASVPAQLHERDGRRYASFGSAVPIHCCTPEQVTEYSEKTHHYCGIFTEQTLAPLGEFALVRLDEDTAEKVFINRSKRLLVLSSDGRLAQWRAAPAFESHNALLPGTPLTNEGGALVGLATAKHQHYYAATGIEGEGGYFETSLPWRTVRVGAGPVYGDRAFEDRGALRRHVASLPPVSSATLSKPLEPVLVLGPAAPRLVLLAADGRQIMHQYLSPSVITDVEYL